MISSEEAKILEQKIRNLSKEKVQSVASLKQILAKGLASFEKSLNALSSTDREVALSLYLERIREVTFEFHMASLRLVARDDARKLTTGEALNARVERYDKDLRTIARIYQIL